MKSRIYSGHAALRRQFKTIAEISEVINRGHNYILDRLNGKKEFTSRDKLMLLSHLGEDPEDLTAIDYYFTEAAG